MNVEDHIPEFLETVLTRPDSFAYFGKLDLDRWGFCLSTHRDADTLVASNWRRIKKDALEKFPDSFEIMECSHSLVGWMDHLMIDTHDKEAVAWYVENVWLPLAAYPVYDEEDWSAAEQDAEEEVFRNCCVSDICKALEEELDDLEGDLEGDLALGHELSAQDSLNGAALQWFRDLDQEQTVHTLFTACEQLFDGRCGCGDDFYVDVNEPVLFAIILAGVVEQYQKTLINPDQQELPL